VLEALSLVKAKDMTFLNVALIEAFNLFAEVRLLFNFIPCICITYVAVYEEVALTHCKQTFNKSSAVAEMGDRSHNRH